MNEMSMIKCHTMHSIDKEDLILKHPLMTLHVSSEGRKWTLVQSVYYGTFPFHIIVSFNNSNVTIRMYKIETIMGN